MAEEGFPRRSREFLRDPLWVLVVAGAVTILGNIAASVFDTIATINEERARRETQLILNAVSATTQEERSSRLTFLAEVGLISDEAGHIRDAAAGKLPAFSFPAMLPMTGVAGSTATA